MRDLTENRRSNRLLGVFALCVFAFVLAFFLGYHPLQVNNMDDWTYLSFSRPAVPLRDAWNPAKVLPEILMPACAQLAVWLVLPLTGDYLLSMSIVFNVVLCLFITAYMTVFARLLMRRMQLDAPMAATLCTLFLALHFRSWMSPWIPSQHLFYSEGLTTTFNYTVPALLNLILVMLLDMPGKASVSGERPVRGGLLIGLLYLAVFSNLYSSVILAAYCGVRMLPGFVRMIRKKLSFFAWLKENLLNAGVLGTWFVSMAFELSGSRAGSMASDRPLPGRIKETVSILLVEIERMENTVFWLCAVMIAAGIAALLLSRCSKEEDRVYACEMLRFLLCAGLTLLYLILLSAVVSPAYIARKDVLIGPVFFVFAAAFFSLAYIIGRWKWTALAVPMAAFVIAFDVLIGIRSFAPSNALQLPQRTCLAIGQSFVETILEADRAGLTEATLVVPKGNDALGNWPYTYNMGYRMADALRNHGLIEHVTDVPVVIDEHFFETFGRDCSPEYTQGGLCP